MGISDIGRQMSQQFILNLLRTEMNETQRQSSTGKKSVTIAGLGSSGASNAVSFRSKINLMDSYTENLNLAKTRMTVMDKSLSSITDVTRDMIAELRNQLQGATPFASISSNDAKLNMNLIADKLNTQVNGRYMFSGDQIDAPAYGSTATLMAQFTAIVPAALTNPATTISSMTTAAQAVSGTNLGYNASTLVAGRVGFRAGDGVDVDYTIKADQKGFSDVMRGMAIVANLTQPTTPTELDNYWNMVNSAIEMMESGAKAIDEYQGLLGNQSKVVADMLTQHSETQLAFEDFVGSVEDVDMGEAAMKFSALQTQLQTSYSIISSVKNLSLVNFL